MSNFRLRDPDCVLIHIPKTGGSTIRRGLWDSNYDGPVFGSIPDGWASSLFKFAFVRHPLDRLLSAYRDFKQHRGYKNDLRSFCHIAMNEKISYEAPTQSMAEKIRHHTIPQTHWYNNLDLADYVGRYETFSVDLAYVLDKVGKERPIKPLPELRRTKKNKPWQEVLFGKRLAKLVEYYKEDFERLGYDLPE